MRRQENRSMNSMFGVGTDGKYFIFVRFRDEKWTDEEPLEVNRHSTERFLWALYNLGQKGKPYQPEYLHGDFGSDSLIAQEGVRTLYDEIARSVLISQGASYFLSVGLENKERVLVSRRDRALPFFGMRFFSLIGLRILYVAHLIINLCVISLRACWPVTSGASNGSRIFVFKGIWYPDFRVLFTSRACRRNSNARRTSSGSRPISVPSGF